MGTIANLITYVGASTGDFHRGMGAVLDTGGQVAAKFVTIGAVATTAIAGVAAAAGKMAIDFQDQMGDVSTLIDGGPAEAMQRFGKDVKRVSVLTGKGLADMTNGLYETISAWGNSAAAAKQFEIAAKAAVGGKAQTIDAVKMLSVVTKGYGDVSVAAVQKVADLAFQTANLGQTTFPELAANMGETVPMANALGIKIESLFGSFATLTGVTGNTSEVATQLKATFSALLNPTTEMAAKLTKLGFANGKAAIESLGLQGVLDLLAEATGGNTAQLAKMFGSTEALNAVLALTGAQSKDFTAKTQAMANAAGAADTAFAKKSSTVASLWGRLKQLGSVMLVDIGEKALPTMTKFAEWAVDNMPKVQGVVESLFAAIGKAIEASTPLVNNFKTQVWEPFVIGVTTGTTTANNDVTGWAQNVGVQIGEVTRYLLNFQDTIWKPFVDGWTQGHTDMEGTSNQTWATIGSIMSSLSSIVGTVLSALVGAWKLFGDDIMIMVQGAFGGTLSIIDGALQVIRSTFSFFIHLFTGDWDALWTDVLGIFEGFWKMITGVLKIAWGAFDGVMHALLGDTWTTFKEWIGRTVAALWDWLQPFWDTFASWVTRFASAAWEWGSDVMSGFWNGLSSWFGRIWSGIEDFVQRATEKVKSVLGIHSPSRVFMGIGENIGAGLALGISASEGMVNRSLADLAGGQVDVAMRSVSRSASGGYTGPREIRIPVTIGDQDLGEYVVDLLTGTVKQPLRAMGLG